jgi:ketosteroid isomerase-like protein
MTTDLFDRYAALDPATTPEAAPDWTSMAPVLLAAVDERTILMQTEPITKATPTPPKRRRRGAIAAVAAFAVIIVAVGAAVVLNRPSDEVSPAAAGVLADYEDARNSGDVDAVMAFYAEDAVVVGHPLDSDGLAMGLIEIHRLENRVPRIQGSTGGIEYTEMVVSGNTVTFNTTFHNSEGDCFGEAGHRVTVENGRITRWVGGSADPSLCG